MRKYVKKIIDEFTINIKRSQALESPATKDLFKMDGIKPLNNRKVGFFHTTVYRGLFLCKRAKMDIHTKIAVLCTRVKHPNQGDEKKLPRLMKYPVGTQELCITLNSDKTGCLKWYVDAALAAHPGFKAHTGANEKRSNCIRVTKKTEHKKQHRSRVGWHG